MKANIYFTGFSGCGKTFLGRMFAEITGKIHVDTDMMVEKAENMKIAEIFETQGEQAFRKSESSVLLLASHAVGQIVSTGGGMMESEENRIIMKSTGLSVFLDTPFDICLSRIIVSSERPLISRIPPSERSEYIEQLYNLRLENYRKCNISVVTGINDPEADCMEILKKIKMMERIVAQN